MSEVSEHDVVIVGGGPAGAAIACLLAREKRAPLLLERDAEPRHKICGEFLSVEAQGYLAGIGIDVGALGGMPIRRVRLVHGRKSAEARLPFDGVGLTRRTMDEALLRQAEVSGATIRRGVSAREIVRDGSALHVLLRGGERLRARTVFLANGKHDLRNPRRPKGWSGSDLIGFKTYLWLATRQRADMGDAVEIILFDGGYAGLQRVEGGMVNLCLLVRRDLFAGLQGSWNALLKHLCDVSPHLRMRLDSATPLLGKPLSISNVPYGFVHQGMASDPDGLFHLGDQMAVIPSFSGDGISIALHTAEIAAETYLAQGNAAAAFHKRMRKDTRPQIRLASALYQLSRARLGRLALLSAFQLYPDGLSRVAGWTRIPAYREGFGRWTDRLSRPVPDCAGLGFSRLGESHNPVAHGPDTIGDDQAGESQGENAIPRAATEQEPAIFGARRNPAGEAASADSPRPAHPRRDVLGA